MPGDDYKAFAQKFGGGVATGLEPASGLQFAPEFRQRVLDSGKRVLVAPALGAGAAVSALAFPEATGGNAPKELQDLNRHAQGSLAAGPEQLSPMDTPLANVPRSAAIDPRYEAMARASGGMGGAGGAGQGLRGKYLDARGKQLGDYDTDKDLAGRAGVAKADRIEEVSALQAIDAEKRARDAEVMQQHQEAAHQKHQAFLDRNVELADDIARQKIDPSRLMRNASTAEKIGTTIGRALGGGLAAMNGGPNQFQARLDKEIDRDIAGQQANIDNKKASLSARGSIFGQMLAETGDRRQAEMATRNLMYEAAKQKLDAEANRLGIPEVLVAADQAKAGLQHQQDALQTDMAKENMVAAQQAAAAAAAAQRAAEERTWQRTMDVQKLALEKDKLNIDRLKAGKDMAKEDDAAVAAAAKALGDDDIVKNRQLVKDLTSKIDSKTGDVQGLTKMDLFRAKLARTGLPAGMILAPNEQDRQTQQEWEQAKLLYQTKVTGSGGSDEQMKKIGLAFEGAGTMAEKRKAIELLGSELKRREGLATGGLTDSQKVTLQQRMARDGLVDMPDSVKRK